MILPKISLKPQRPECKQGSSCSIFHKLSENHSLENSPWGEQGLLVAQGLYILVFDHNAADPVMQKKLQFIAQIVLRSLRIYFSTPLSRIFQSNISSIPLF
jgi:hypothetical protein